MCIRDRSRHQHAIWVECGSGDILRDMDTPGDYQEVQERYLRQIPTREECYGMLRAEKTPPVVIAHCEAVACKAVELAEKLVQKGLPINLELTRSGALVHDICRVQKNHAQGGAKVLRQNGFEKVAQIVAVHMEGTEQMTQEISEASLVFYACLLYTSWLYHYGHGLSGGLHSGHQPAAPLQLAHLP